jgi:hypothetical protein
MVFDQPLVSTEEEMTVKKAEAENTIHFVADEEVLKRGRHKSIAIRVPESCCCTAYMWQSMECLRIVDRVLYSGLIL